MQVLPRLLHESGLESEDIKRVSITVALFHAGAFFSDRGFAFVHKDQIAMFVKREVGIAVDGLIEAMNDFDVIPWNDADHFLAAVDLGTHLIDQPSEVEGSSFDGDITGRFSFY